MTHNFTVNPDGTTTVNVDFNDEGVILQGETSVKGGEDKAMAYLPFFESDLRRNFADKFPVQEVTPDPNGGMI